MTKFSAEKSSTSSFKLFTEDGTEVLYHLTGCTGDKNRTFFTYDREPCELGHLDPKKKQAVLKFLKSHGDIASVIIHD